MIPGSANPLLLASAAGSPAPSYQIERSLRFNSSDSAYLSRTPSVAGNRKTWTWAGWVKISAGKRFFSVGTSAANDFAVGFYGDRIDCINREGGNLNARIVSDAFYRDPSAWYHFLCVWDTTAVAPSDRFQAWINGERITSFILADYPSQNLDGICNTGLTHYIGSQTLTAGEYFSGYLADIHFIDGQALDPTSFGEFDANGVWQPKAYTGSYPGNSFHLDFADNSAATTAGIGKDVSGNGNDWTPVNLSVAAGAGNDSLVDTPTNYGEDTGAGGEVRGNYCTWNPLDAFNGNGGSWPLLDGNLVAADNALNIYGTVSGTLAVSSGKWYWEISTSVGLSTIDAYAAVGIEEASKTGRRYAWSGNLGYYAYFADGRKLILDGTQSSYGSSWTLGTIGVALDLDGGTITFYRNNVSQGSIPISNDRAYRPIVSDFNNGAGTIFTANFGQRPFAYTAPSGFKALCTTNLPDPVVAKPSEVMDIALYTGNNTARSITGLQFSPDWVWLKARSNAGSYHKLYDTVRGATKLLNGTNDTLAESTETQGLTAFNSDGFSLGTDGNHNGNGITFVGWCWDAGSSTVSNTDGSITSQVRANPSAGFSICTFTTPASGDFSFGHGLGVAPAFVIFKFRSVSSNWYTYHTAIGQKYIILNSTGAAATNEFTTAPTSTIFTYPSSLIVGPSQPMVAYCFAPVAGYTASFSYTGNGSADGPFVFTNMQPKLILLKCSSTTGNWIFIDTEREGYNVDNDPLYPNSSNAEGTTDLADILSNGFKIRSTDADVNTSAATYIGYAWAENPFVYSRAR